MNPEKQKIKVGFMPYGVHVGVKDATDRYFIDEKLLQEAKDMLANKGLDVISSDEIVSYKPQAKAALDKFIAADIDVLVMYAATWVWASELVWMAQEIRRKIIVWAPAVSHGWPHVGATVVHGALAEVGIGHKFIIGMPGDEATQKKLLSAAKAAKAVKQMSGSTFGLIGGRGMGQTPGVADPSQLMRMFGMDVEHTDQLVVIEKAQSQDMDAVREAYGQMLEKFDEMPPLEGVMEKSVRLYLALKELYDERNYDFASVKCYPELGDGYATPCLAQSLMSDEGYTSSCIGDINTALSAHALGAFSEGAVFSGDVQQVIYQENIVKVVCDGGCPPSLRACTAHCKVCMRGLPTEGAEGGMGISTVLKEGRCTLAHLARVNGRYVMHITPGEVYGPPPGELKEKLRECGMPHWSHAFVKIDGCGENYYQNQYSEFTSLGYGDLTQGIIDFCDFAGIDYVVT
jgi:L-fucose isomerase-like protein